eukprot:CAMPEP_0201558854 /NCGR_PEP_ID=MMETSP0173_2-20130828/70482_1 /ASSEMBLY_ACC=CAM_ASM_000268 /TAXON_ID=218659 /ORGANISM="Vexillifera sp., Strain DIVA3 564/2" /LENGTH=546 /DNA_ID=CAMNT_0047972495 /DNA_START=55 /DNA_END=1695 /DNA_ORIENTATION=-
MSSSSCSTVETIQTKLSSSTNAQDIGESIEAVKSLLNTLQKQTPTDKQSNIQQLTQYNQLLSLLRDKNLLYRVSDRKVAANLTQLRERVVNEKLAFEDQVEVAARKARRSVESAGTYDLTARNSVFLDRHLILPLLEFLQSKNIYQEKDILQAKLDLLSKTNMVDFAVEIFQSLNGADAENKEMSERRNQVIERLESLKAQCAPMLQLIEAEHSDASGQSNGGDAQQPLLIDHLIEQDLFNMKYLGEHHQITQATLDAFYHYAKFQFECGVYASASEHLKFYRHLSSDEEKKISAVWGIVASDILLEDWESALNFLNILRDLIDAKQFENSAHQLQQRTWLIHWSLFVFFNHPNGRNGIVDLFFQEKYLNAVQTTCPHVLRYLASAVIINKRRRNVLHSLIKVIQQESDTYSDPITEFLECLYVQFDFDGAQHKLAECETVLANDFFLVGCRDEFIENARLFIFETYCRIHSCVDIGMLAQKLNMEKKDAERWIVNLIRDVHLDAKIDSAKNQVIMAGSQTPSIYQQLIEKTKVPSLKTYSMASQL